MLVFKKMRLFSNTVIFFQLQRSDDKTIVLRDLHVDMTGKYTCEVTTEGTFETVKDMAKMTVIGKPINIVYLRLSYGFDL